MLNFNAPEHIMNYCYKDEVDANFSYLCLRYEGEYSFVYKLKCICECERFIVYKDEHPSVFAECSNCRKMITVYDLDYYPAAVKLKKDYPVNRVNEKGVFVYVNYEYNDEFIYEEDVDFDSNDITWGKVFIANDNELKKF